jgi:hypothetical protein
MYLPYEYRRLAEKGPRPRAQGLVKITDTDPVFQAVGGKKVPQREGTGHWSLTKYYLRKKVQNM